MSPDGNYIAAVKYDNTSLYLRDNTSGRWVTCVSMAAIQEPIWHSGSSWVQFVAGVRPGEAKSVYRITPACAQPQRIVDLADRLLIGDSWIGIGPNGAPIGFVRQAPEIWALDWSLRRKAP